MALNILMADPLMTIFGHRYFIYICVIYLSATRIQQVILDLQKWLMIIALIFSNDSNLPLKGIFLN